VSWGDFGGGGGGGWYEGRRIGFRGVLVWGIEFD